MKICIDISQIVYGTGVSEYTKNLVRSLLKIDKKNKYLLFAGVLRRKSDIKKYLNSLEGSFEYKILPFSPFFTDIIWNRLHAIKIDKLVGDIDIYHSSDWAQAPSDAYKVTTIHDLVPIKFPKYSHPKIISTHKAKLKHVKSEANIVIVPSKTTKKDLINLGFDKNKVKVIYEAPDKIYKASSKGEIARLKKKLRIKEGYLLAVGLGYRKNTERLINAFEKAKSGRNLKLVILGYSHEKYSEKRGVIFTGHVPRKDMPTYYSGAEALIYPSLYEGFGLPILEAYACKTPVVTSNVGSMKEIGSDSAVLVDPFKENSITEGILKVLGDRKKYIKLGQKVVKNFSWEKTAEETLKVYESINK